MFSDQIVQSAVLFKHGCPIPPRNFINFHGSLDHFPIQGAERIEELANIGSSSNTGTQFAPWLSVGLGHRSSS